MRCRRLEVILVSALKSPVEVKGSLSLVNPGGQELSLQELWGSGREFSSWACFLASYFPFWGGWGG